MIGIFGFDKAKFADIFATNTDKNYLTPTEIPALADNQLLNITQATVHEMLLNRGVLLLDDDRHVIAHAVAIANFAREFKL